MTQEELFEGVPFRPAPERREADIQAECVDYARRKGCYARKFSSPSNRSVPDYIFLWKGKTWYVEFKRPGKEPTEAQWNEIAKIIIAGGRVDVIDNPATFKTEFERYFQ